MKKTYKIDSLEHLDGNHIMFKIRKYRCPKCRKSKPVYGLRYEFFFSDENGKTRSGHLICQDCRLVFSDNKYLTKLIIIKRLSKQKII